MTSSRTARALLSLALALWLVSPALGQAATAGRPNIVLILADDVALMDLGVYGGEARTPTIDALARRGAMFTRHHASPLCSPSRAMLLTGADNHVAGVATIEEVLPREQRGKSGYGLSLSPATPTLATRLKALGYRTYMTGKWHLGSGPGDLPADHGFDRSLALDASGADNFRPQSYMPYYADAPWFEGRSRADMPERFYSSDLIVDRMLDYMREDDSSGQPFFAYLAFQAVHIPVQAPEDRIRNYEGRYAAGWEALREERAARAVALGLAPPGAPLAPWPEDFRRWSSLSAEEKAMASGSMAVYAAMIEAMDAAIGRLVQTLSDNGTLANTIFVITSDNGPEPSDPVHAPLMNVWMGLNGYHWRLDGLGGEGSLAFIGREWAQAVATPGKLFKFYASEGGIRVPMIISGPGIAPGRRDGASFVIDIAPTLLDKAGASSDVMSDPIFEGRSLADVLAGEATAVRGPDEPVGLEVSGAAALFQGDYKLLRTPPPMGDGRWRLFNYVDDPGETRDLSAGEPARFSSMLSAYEAYALRVGVLDMPRDYQASRQIAINLITRLLARVGPYVLLAFALCGVLFWVLRRRRVRR